MISKKTLDLVARVPLYLPEIVEFDGGFVASGFVLSRDSAKEILECDTYMPFVRDVKLRPIFKWCPMRDTFDRDIMNGQPSDQWAEEWDYPCGIKLAKSGSEVYGGIDRILNANAGWRNIDDKAWVFAVNGDRYLLACVGVKP